MFQCPWHFLIDEKKHIISLVGGGGKTTIMYELAAHYAQAGKRVVALTTTHIWLPCSDGLASEVYAPSMEAVQDLWQGGSYAVIGTLEQGTGKLIAPAADLLQAVLRLCDVAIIEADGAKQMPCKLPAEHEPVLLPECDIVIGVVGLDALGKSLEEGCFRWQLGREIFASSCNLLIDEVKVADILTSEQGSRKAVGTRDYYIAINKCELVEPANAEHLVGLLVERGITRERIWLRGKGV